MSPKSNGNNNVPEGGDSNGSVKGTNGLLGTSNGTSHPLPSPIIRSKEEFEQTPKVIVVICILSYVVMNLFGYLRDFLRRVGLEKTHGAVELNREGYVPLYSSYESFYTRNIYRRICHAWNQPICSMAGYTIDVMDRHTNDSNMTFTMPGTAKKAINLGSYNYLGFAENTGIRAENVDRVIKKYGIGMATCRHEMGTRDDHIRLEKVVAKFMGVEDSAVFGMGFATNSTNIPTLASKGSLIFSDSLNHASLILGCRLTGAQVKTFKHNDPVDLEKKLRQALVEGQPRTRRPWTKVIIMIEGVYSMEGTMAKLPEIIAIKKRYKCYLYLDEAHSIGAVGPTGRGLCDYYGCDPKDVDLLMGTFTKSFGAAGGYIAGKKEVIDYIRSTSHSFGYATSMAAPVIEQVISVFQAMDGPEGQHRTKQLARNVQYFRKKLKQLGFIVYGHEDSPVVPMLIFFPGKIVAFVREALTYGLACVGAGFPATPLIESRVRFCLSASHNKEMLDRALEVTSFLGDKYCLKYSRKSPSTEEVVY